jgi:glycine oxidase
MAPQTDVLIVGAGVMGCAIALELALRGAQVLVLERSVPGAEASSAAAGMLGAQVESHAPGPFTSLCIESRARFPAWASKLREMTGIDVEHRVCGITKVALDADEAASMEAHVAWQREAGLPASMLGKEAARAHEPSITEATVAAATFAADGRVDPPRLMRALRIAAERAGAVFRSGAYVRNLVVAEGRAEGVELDGGIAIGARHVVVATGSWTGLVGAVPIAPGAIKPARGQIVELLVAAPIMRGVVWGKAAYLSPRDDGRVLVGSTLEFVGFERGVTAGAVRDLLAGAIGLVPALERAELGRVWSNFRPHTSSELPLIGASSVRNVWLATGHFRNGILLSPLTAQIVAALVLGETPPFDPTPFGP